MKLTKESIKHNASWKGYRLPQYDIDAVREAARMKKRLLCKRKETGDMRLGFFTLRGRKFLHRNFRTSVFCAVRTHLPEKRELFGKIKAARGADG